MRKKKVHIEKKKKKEKGRESFYHRKTIPDKWSNSPFTCFLHIEPKKKLKLKRKGKKIKIKMYVKIITISFERGPAQ